MEIEKYLDDRTLSKWKELHEFYDDQNIGNIKKELECIVTLERKYVQKRKGMQVDEYAFDEMKANRFEEQINNLYHVTIQALGIASKDRPNADITMEYNLQRKTELLRIVMDQYGDI